VNQVLLFPSLILFIRSIKNAPCSRQGRSAPNRKKMYRLSLITRKYLNKFPKLKEKLVRFLSVSFSIRVVNFVFQRIFRINSQTHWSVHYTSIVVNPHKIQIGRGVSRSFAVSGHCYIQGYNGIEIGDETIFAPGVKIISTNHDNVTFAAKKTRPIKIGKHCWLAANSVILPRVELGDNVIVGAGAVVTKSFGKNSVIAGVPAKSIRKDKNGIDSRNGAYAL